ncbi:MAG: SDR family oxidoreductase [Coriobacteriales bacterium]|jgi:NAD(P)-dependent dehydrogenase (short-subunit alcohol dehydrogenase family)|nr:SDR family oxidoreductase [Coriobacteriales bacterium]
MPITSLKDAFSVKGKNVLITGGTQGLGNAIADGYAELGANVGFTGRTQEKGEAAAAKLQAKYPDVKIRFYCADQTVQEDAQAAVNDYVRDFGTIDVLVNNAGCGGGADSIGYLEDNFANWHKVIALDLTAYFMMSAMAAEKMRDTGGGSIINITSNAGLVVNKPQKMVNYSTAKAGANHMTEMLAWEWAEYGIRVNAIAPGYFKTALAIPDLAEQWLEMTPSGRFGEPIEVAALAVYLGSAASEQMTGAILVIDGGYQLAN